MTFKISLSLALLAFIFYLLAGSEMLRAVSEALVYFIITYFISTIVDVAITSIRAMQRRNQIEERKRREAENREEEKDAVSEQLLRLLKESQIS